MPDRLWFSRWDTDQVKAFAVLAFFAVAAVKWMFFATSGGFSDCSAHAVSACPCAASASQCEVFR